MKKILLSAGHGGVDSGSIGADKVKEKDRTNKLVRDLAAYLMSAYTVSVTIKQEKNAIGKWSQKNRYGYDYALSIHFNAFNKSATGVECLYKTQKTHAQSLSSKVAVTLGLKNRGAKLRTDLYMLNIGFDNLVEVCFHDNTADVVAYNKNYSTLVKNLGDEIARINKLPKKVVIDTKKEDVKKLQTTLNMLGFKGADGKPLVVDGVAGKNTKYAVNNYLTTTKVVNELILKAVK